MLRRRSRSIVQRDFQEDDLHDDHEACLEEERERVAGAEPVEEPVSPGQFDLCEGAMERMGLLEDTRNQHDQGNVEREPIAALRFVYREDLVCVGGNGGEDETVCSVSCIKHIRSG
jgi:hypothetical protein